METAGIIVNAALGLIISLAGIFMKYYSSEVKASIDSVKEDVKEIKEDVKDIRRSQITREECKSYREARRP